MGKVLSILQQSVDRELTLEVMVYPSIDGDIRCRATDKGDKQFFNASSVIEALVWYVEHPNVIRVAIPPALLYR